MFLSLSKESMKNRMLERKQNSKVQRSDDTLEILEKRISVFEEDTLKIVERFRLHSRLIELQGENAPEEILEEYLYRLQEI